MRNSCHKRLGPMVENRLERVGEEGSGLAEKMAKLKTVLTIGEVAEMLRVHPTTIYRLVKRGELPGFKVGGNWRINSTALESWLEERSKRVNLSPRVD